MRAIVLTKLEDAVLHCRDCKLWADGLGFDPDKEYQVWTFRNGMSMNWGMGDVPLWSDYVLCSTHEEQAKADLDNN